jgi:hypothetical protein
LKASDLKMKHRHAEKLNTMLELQAVGMTQALGLMVEGELEDGEWEPAELEEKK